MSQPTPIVMFGAAGRMGRMILKIAAEQPQQYRVVGAVEHSDHPGIGQPVCHWVPGIDESVILSDEPPSNPPEGTVGIHFSLPEGTMAHLDWSRQGGWAAVIGTTGFSAEQLTQIESIADQAPILLTPNTSLGVNVLFWLTRQATRLLGASFDVEIVEIHHNKKKDAPSGTAQRLLEVVQDQRAHDSPQSTVAHGRHGNVGERPAGEIGMHALRGGDVTGEHTVVFAGPRERIELTHRAHSREVFAEGALVTAAYLSRQVPGWYTMQDALGI